MTQAKIVALLKGVARAAGGAALVAVAAYLTSHKAADPALYAALIVGVTEVYAALRARHYVTTRRG